MVSQCAEPSGIGVETRHDAYGEDRPQQRGCDGGDVHCRIERADGNGAFKSTYKKGLDLAEPSAYQITRRARHRRAVERGVDEQAAAMIRVGERHRDQLVEKVANGAERIRGGGETGETRQQSFVRIAAQRRDEQALFVGEAVIERRRTQARRLGEVAQRRPDIAVLPEHVGGAFENGLVGKRAGSRHRPCPEAAYALFIIERSIQIKPTPRLRARPNMRKRRVSCRIDRGIMAFHRRSRGGGFRLLQTP